MDDPSRRRQLQRIIADWQPGYDYELVECDIPEPDGDDTEVWSSPPIEELRDRIQQLAHPSSAATQPTSTNDDSSDIVLCCVQQKGKGGPPTAVLVSLDEQKVLAVQA